MNETESVKSALKVIDILSEQTDMHEYVEYWKTYGKQVLTIHDELLTEILLSESDPVTTEIFRAIPYDNPIVVFQKPIMLPDHGKYRNTVLWGFAIAGARLWDVKEFNNADDATVSSADPNAHGIVMIPCLTAMHSNRNLMAVQIIPFPDERYNTECLKASSLYELISISIENFSGIDPIKEPDFFGHHMDLYRICLSACMYLASKTTDVSVVPNKTVSKMISKQTRKPGRKSNFTLTRIGWDIGSSLSSLRRQNTISLDPTTGKMQSPQHRKAHFKIVWTGPGRKIPRVTFIAPYWTHKEQLSNYFVNKIRGVGK